MRMKHRNDELIDQMATIDDLESHIESTWDDLPEFLIQHIQSFLPEKDAVRSSVLSKSCLRAWSTLDCLRFRQNRFRSLREFAASVRTTLERYRRHDLLVKRLEIHLDYLSAIQRNLEDDFMLIFPSSLFVNQWIRVVHESRLEELVLEDTDATRWQLGEIFFSKTLQKCRYLRVLSLCKVHICQRAIQETFSSCSLLETVTLSDCKGFERIRLGGPITVDNLRSFEIRSSLPHVIVEIDDAPSLRSFVYRTKPRQIRICASQDLTRLEIYNVSVSKDSFRGYLAMGSFINLFGDHNINISCDSLEKLSVEFRSEKDIHMQVNIQAPSLHQLRYSTERPSSLCFNGKMTHCAQGPTSIELTKLPYHLDAVYFLGLRLILGSLNQSRVLVLIDWSINNEISNIDFTIMDPLVAPSIEEITFEDKGLLKPSKSYHSAVVDAFFSVCRPRYVRFLWLDDFARLFLSKLNKVQENSSCCHTCDKRGIRCWLHHVKGVEIGVPLRDAAGKKLPQYQWTSLEEISIKELEPSGAIFMLQW